MPENERLRLPVGGEVMKLPAEGPEVYFDSFLRPHVADSFLERLISIGQGAVVQSIGHLAAGYEALAGDPRFRETIETASSVFAKPRQVEDPNKLAWAVEQTVAQLPNVAATVGGGALAMAAGAPAMVGVGAASLMLNSGETFNSLRNLGVERGEAALATVPTGVAKSALDIITPGGVVMGKLGKTVAGRLAKGAVTEGLTEGAQEMLDIGAEKALDVNRPEENVSRVLNAIAGGAISSAGFHVLTPKELQEPVEEPKKEAPPEEAHKQAEAPAPESPIKKLLKISPEQKLELTEFSSILGADPKPLIDFGLIRREEDGSFSRLDFEKYGAKAEVGEDGNIVVDIMGEKFSPVWDEGSVVGTVKDITVRAKDMESLLAAVKGELEEMLTVEAQQEQGPQLSLDFGPREEQLSPSAVATHQKLVVGDPLAEGDDLEYAKDAVRYSSVDLGVDLGVRKVPTKPVVETPEFAIYAGEPTSDPPSNGVLPVAILRDGVFLKWAELPVDYNSMIGGVVPSFVSIDLPVDAFDDQMALKEGVFASLKEAINTHIVGPAKEQAAARRREVWNSLIPFGKSGVGKKNVVYVFDETGTISKALQAMRGKEITSEFLVKLHDVLRTTYDSLRSSIGLLTSEEANRIVERLKGVGMLVSPDKDGMWLQNPDNPEEGVMLINPFSFALEATSIDQFAEGIKHTIIHELAHAAVPLHSGEGFVETEAIIARSLGDALARIGEVIREKLAGETALVDQATGREYRGISNELLTASEQVRIIGERLGERDVRLEQASQSSLGRARRAVKRLREEKNPERVAALWRTIRAELEKNPGLVADLLQDEEFARVIEERKASLGPKVVVFRDRLPARGKAFVEAYVKRAMAEGREVKYPLPPDALFDAPELSNPMWVRFGKYSYKLRPNKETGMVEVVYKGRTIGEGTWDEVRQRLKEEKEAIEKELEKRRAVEAMMVDKSQIAYLDDRLVVLRRTPLDGLDLRPNLRMQSAEPRENAPAHKEAAKKLRVLTNEWPEWAKEQGLKDLSLSVSYLRKFYTLLQLGYTMPKFKPLQSYIDEVRAFWKTKTSALIDAHELITQWSKLGFKRADIFGKVAQKVTMQSFAQKRRLTDDEVVAIVKSYGGDGRVFELWKQIDGALREAGLRMVDALRDEAKRIYGPEVYKILEPQFNQSAEAIENSNYFPLTRFGKYAVEVRDEAGNLLAFESYIRRGMAERRAKALRAEGLVVAQRYLSDTEVSILQFPPGLASMLEEQLDLTTEQIRKLKEIQYKLAPGQSFLKHRLKRSNVPGADKDAMAALSQYYMHYANHLARLKHRRALSEQVEAMKKTVAVIPDGYTLGRVVETVEAHMGDLMNPTSDMAWLRSGLFTFMFAFMPAMAFVNLTQVPLYTFPYLAKRLGGNPLKAMKMLLEAQTTLMKGLKDPKAYSELELELLERGYQEGFLEESYATEIAGIAQKTYLDTFIEGRPIISFHAQRLTRSALWMFSAAEAYNRKVTFLAAIKTAQAIGIAGEDNIFRFAREAVDKTQAEYAAWNRPEIFRGGEGLSQIKPLLGVFKLFLQNHLYFAFTNQGGWLFWAVMLAANGLRGFLPFEDDLVQIIELVGTVMKKKLGLKNPKVDLETMARKMIAQMGANPDLVLHGLASQGFGLPYIAALFGLPFPGFDLSNTVSMQGVLPFLQPLKQALLSEIRPKDAVMDAFIRTLGVAFTTGVGAGSGLISAINGDFRRGSGLLPRQLRYMVQALDGAVSGAFKSSTGEPLVKLRLDDPYHVAEIVEMALGFTPARVAQAQRLNFAVREHIAFYTAWKERLITEYALAVDARDKKAIAEAINDVRQFQKMAPEEFRFHSGELKQAILERVKDRKLKELGLPPQKRYLMFGRRMRELYMSTPTQ